MQSKSKSMDYSKHKYPATLITELFVFMCKKMLGTFSFQDCLINSLQQQFGLLINTFIPPEQCLFSLRTVDVGLEDIFLSSLQVSPLSQNFASDVFHTVLWVMFL